MCPRAFDLQSLHELTGQREQLAVALQDLDAESQRLIYPILRLKMVQHILFAALKDTRKNGTSFVQAVRKKSLIRMLEKVRDELNNDPENAKRIENEWFHNVQMGLAHEEVAPLRHASLARELRPCAAAARPFSCRSTTQPNPHRPKAQVPTHLPARLNSRFPELRRRQRSRRKRGRCFRRRRCFP